MASPFPARAAKVARSSLESSSDRDLLHGALARLGLAQPLPHGLLQPRVVKEEAAGLGGHDDAARHGKPGPDQPRQRGRLASGEVVQDRRRGGEIEPDRCVFLRGVQMFQGFPHLVAEA